MKRNKSTLSKVVNVIITVLIILALCVAAFFMVGRITGKPLFLFGKTAVLIMTDSMEPLIPARSFVLMEEVDPSTISVDDVVMFRSDDPALNGGFNTHRVIEIKDGGKTLITKGDHNYVEDIYPAKAENVVGRFVKVLPVTSALIRFFSTPFGLVVLFIILAGLCAAAILPEVLRKMKTGKQKKSGLDEAEKQKLIESELERLKNENKDETKND